MGWKENKREQGFRDVLVWLDPAAVVALEALKASSPGASVADIISRAVAQAAGGVPEVAGRDPVEDLKDQLAAVDSRLAVVEDDFRDFKDDEDFHEKQAIRERLDALETLLRPAAPAGDGGKRWSLDQYSQSSPSNEATPEAEAAMPDAPVVEHEETESDPPKRTRTKIDDAVLIQAVADHVQKAGWDFSRMELCRELRARGVAVHSNDNHFTTWVKRHLAAIENELIKRRDGWAGDER